MAFYTCEGSGVLGFFLHQVPHDLKNSGTGFAACGFVPVRVV